MTKKEKATEVVVALSLCFTLLSFLWFKKQEAPKRIETASGGWFLVWNDEFDYRGLPDSSKWSYDTHANSTGWGNNELQYYTERKKKNAYVSVGTLKIRAIKESVGEKEYTSARLVSRGKGDWRYGRVEVRAKVPVGQGLWSAIWMLPSDTLYGGWLRSGEIDLMENVGYAPDTIYSAIHCLAYNELKGNGRVGKHTLSDSYNRFHIYEMEWEEQEIRFYCDDQLYYRFWKEEGDFSVWPFDQPFYLILNLAVGGPWASREGIDPNAFPQSLEIDYVRVYQRKR